MVGVGFESVDDNAAWAAEQAFPYELWTDVDKELARYYGAIDAPSDAIDAPSDAAPARITVLLDEHGAVALWYRDDLERGTAPLRVLHDIDILWGE